MPEVERSTRSGRDSLTVEQLGQALNRLVATGTLTSGQAKAVRREVAAVKASGAPSPGPARAPLTTALAEIGAYVGGAFVLGAAAVLVSDSWDALSDAARLAVLDVPGVMLLAAAWYAWRVARPVPEGEAGRDLEPGARRRMVAVFVVVAAALLGGGTAVLVDLGADGPASGEWAVAGAFWTALAITGAGYALLRGPLLHLGAGVALAGGIQAIVAATTVDENTASGWALVGVAVVWAAATATRLVGEREVGFGWAGCLAFVGGEVLVGTGHSAAAYAVLALLAAAGLAGFVVLRAFALLVTGAGTLAVVVPQFVIDVADGALGAAGALLVVGLSIVGASVLALRLRRTAPPSRAEGRPQP